MTNRVPHGSFTLFCNRIGLTWFLFLLAMPYDSACTHDLQSHASQCDLQSHASQCREKRKKTQEQFSLASAGGWAGGWGGAE